MLILSRRTGAEGVWVGSTLIRVLSSSEKHVKLGFAGPQSDVIVREELHRKGSRDASANNGEALGPEVHKGSQDTA